MEVKKVEGWGFVLKGKYLLISFTISVRWISRVFGEVVLLIGLEVEIKIIEGWGYYAYFKYFIVYLIIIIIIIRLE